MLTAPSETQTFLAADATSSADAGSFTTAGASRAYTQSMAAPYLPCAQAGCG